MRWLLAGLSALASVAAVTLAYAAIWSDSHVAELGQSAMVTAMIAVVLAGATAGVWDMRP